MINPDRCRQAIEAALDQAVPPAAGSNSQVVDAMRYSLLSGGKRVRPLITLAFCDLCGGDWQEAMPFACAIEMVHTYSLIHDDLPCMDNDDLRRGRPTCHKAFGEAMALLAGDGLLTQAFHCALGYPDPVKSTKATRCLAELAGYKGMVGGQCIDLCADGKTVDIKLLQAMDAGKTVALISAACQMGCIAAGAGSAALDAAKLFAQGVGMAFQIRDDVLDVLGDASKLGKNTGMDAAHDKRNYVSLLGVEEAQKLVESYTQGALEALWAFPGDSGFLRDFALSLAGRNH